MGVELLVVPVAAAQVLGVASSTGHCSSGRGTLKQWQNLGQGVRGSNGDLGKALDESTLHDPHVAVTCVGGFAVDLDHDCTVVVVIAVLREELGSSVKETVDTRLPLGVSICLTDC